MSSRHEVAQRQLKTLSLHGVQATWGRTNRPCPSLDEIILSMGEWQAGILGAQGETFFLEPVFNEEQDVAARGRHIALGQTYLALHLKGRYSIGAHRREYLKLVGSPDSVGEVLSKKGADHDRRLGLAPRSYQERLSEFAPSEDSYYDEPFADLEETLTMQRCMALLSSREQISFVRMLAHQPPVDNPERLARQRVRKKIRFYLESRAEWRAKHEREDAPMSATTANAIIAHVDQRFDRIERLEKMRAEAMDSVRATVEQLAQRFTDDERVQDAVEQFLDEESMGA